MQCPNCQTINRPTAKFCQKCGSRFPSLPLPLGTIVHARYRTVSVLGQGGMGVVYTVEDQNAFNKKLALKELIEQFATPADRAQAIQGFEHEAKLLVQLSHANLPTMTEYFSENNRYYLVMELIEGETLEDILLKTTGFLPEANVIDWAGQVCDVLTYLHSQKPPVIFRDLKPTNIMLTKDGRIKLIDFGIARMFDPSKKTDTLKLGTIGYAAPEQYAGRGQTDARSDVYALGATIHRLLTKYDPSVGHPFVFPSCQSLNAMVSKAMADIVARATHYDPQQRYQTASDMKQALLAASGAGSAPTQKASSTPASIGAGAAGAAAGPQQPITWVQTFPDPIFTLKCSHCAKVTNWVFEESSEWNSSSARYFNRKRVRCLKCDNALVVETKEAGNLKGIQRFFCSACREDTDWLIYEHESSTAGKKIEGYACLKCGRTTKKT